MSRSFGRISGFRDNGVVRPLICIQGGGAKGAWQAGVLESLLQHDSISPIALFGSSAGAINSLLASKKIENKESKPFKKYWLKSKKVEILQLIIVTLLYLPIFLFLNLKSCILNKIRQPGLIPYWIYKHIVSWRLPKANKSDILIYIYATNIDRQEPPTYNSQNLFTFHISKNSESAITKDKVTLSIKDAVSISCCLPFVNPKKIGTNYFADGGIYSNLPIDVIATQGALGGNSIIILLSKPLREFDLISDDIDYNSLLLLHKIKRNQHKSILKVLEGIDKGETLFSGPSYMNSLILIVEPDGKLLSERTKGFFFRKLQQHDYRKGIKSGTKIKVALNNFLSNSWNELESLLLINIDLPSLPVDRPNIKPFWIDWVNKNWKQI